MKLTRLALFGIALWLVCGAAGAAKSTFTAQDGVWLENGKPFCSTSAHAIFHHFRIDREEGIKELEGLKKAGFSVIEVYWQWQKDLDPATNEYSFKVFDDFMAQCKRIGLKTFCMFQEYTPDWLANKYGWGHLSEEGVRDVRCDDFYVCDPSFTMESKRFYTTLATHLKKHPEVSEDVLYYNMGGEYKPFRPNRQPKPLDYGYDDLTVSAFRKWLPGKGFTLASIAKRWGAGVYRSWNEVWPAIAMKDTDFKGRALGKIGAARWDWFEFRQEISSQHMADAVRWLREAGDTRPLIHEYNTVIPGELPLFLDWSRVGARAGKDGIYLGSGTFDREFDFPSLLGNLAIARGASDAPWQSNEQKGNTPPEWMTRHAWIMMALGGTGMHLWEWRGDDWGVVKKDATPGEGYASAVRLNAEIDFLGDLLNGSKPMPNRIGILSLAEETLFVQYAHDREKTAILKALMENGSGGEVAVITEDQVLRGLSGYKVIITNGQARMRRSVREKLAQYVRDGGTLWITPGTAVKDETDADFATSPGAPLDKVAGVRVTGDIAPIIDEVTGFKHPRTPYAILDKATVTTTATPIRFVQGKPVVWRNSFGKGRCYFQAACMAYPPVEKTPLSSDKEGMKYYLKSNAGQLPIDLLSSVLGEQGVGPYAQAFASRSFTEEQLRAYKTGLAQSSFPFAPLGTVIVGVRKANPGYLVFLTEGDNRDTSVRVQLDSRRLGIEGEWVAYCPETLERCEVGSEFGRSFDTKLQPAETKIFHLLPAAQASKWVTHFRDRNWPAIVAKLPQFPEKKLLPPSEIGKIDLGDLASVCPKPYDTKWLLLNLSKHANRSLVDEGKQENAKAFLGSVGTGDNDLGELPKGLNTFLGVPYEILDPAVNKNSCLITKTNGRPWLGPLEFTGIAVRGKVSKIHWLYGSGWAPFDLPIGYITYHYSDGAVAQENIICAKNIMNWWGRAEKYENANLQLAWAGSTPAAARNYTTVGLYHYAWTNPHPDKTLETIDITSYGGDACLIVVAITGER